MQFRTRALTTSDAHEGLKQAIATVLSGAPWQRCRVHFMRNLLATVPKGAREAIAAVVRTIFAQPDHATAMTQLRKVAEGLRTRFGQAAALLEDAAEDILAYRHLPLEHQRQLHSTNPLERLNKEIKRRSNVVDIFPTPQSVIRLVGAILLEQDDEWAVAERCYFSAESMKQLTAPTLPGHPNGFTLVPHFSYVACCMTSYLILSTLWILRSNTDRRAQARLEEAHPCLQSEMLHWSSAGKPNGPSVYTSRRRSQTKLRRWRALTMGRFSNGRAREGSGGFG